MKFRGISYAGDTRPKASLHEQADLVYNRKVPENSRDESKTIANRTFTSLPEIAMRSVVE